MAYPGFFDKARYYRPIGLYDSHVFNEGQYLGRYMENDYSARHPAYNTAYAYTNTVPDFYKIVVDSNGLKQKNKMPQPAVTGMWYRLDGTPFPTEQVPKEYLAMLLLLDIK